MRLQFGKLHFYHRPFRAICRCLLIASFLTQTLSCLAQTLQVNYQYDKAKERKLGVAKDGWYLPIEKQFVDFHNGQSNSPVKYTIDVTTGKGFYWYRDGYHLTRIAFYEVPSQEHYFIHVSSEGIGFEGHAVINFIHLSDKKLFLDRSYGFFSNNQEGNYSSSFYSKKKVPSNIENGLYEKYKPQLPELDIIFGSSTKSQDFNSDDLSTLRKGNTLYFGLVPPQVATASLIHSTASFFIEVSPEEYQFRLYSTKSRFNDEVRMVDSTYLYDQLQKDWRFLFGSNILHESNIINVFPVGLETKSFPEKTSGNEQMLFPHIDIQYTVLTAGNDPSKSGNFIKDLADRYDKEPRSYVISTAHALKTKYELTDSALVVLDSSFGCPLTPYRGFYNFSVMPMLYRGKIKNGKANGRGILYLAWDCNDTVKNNFFTLDAFFVDGIPNGKFKYTYHDKRNKLIVKYSEGSFKNGKLDGQLVRNNGVGYLRSKATYRKGVIDLNQEMVFHNYDPLVLFGSLPKMSDFYGKYINGEQYGIDIPADTAIKGIDANVFLTEDVIYVQNNEGSRIVIPYYRDYRYLTIQPSGQVFIFYPDGSKLISNWDDKYLIGGKSYYFWAKYNNWFETQVTNGGYVVDVVFEKERKKNIWDKVVGAVKTMVTAPVHIAETAIKVGQGKASLKDLANATVSAYLEDLGAKMQLQGELVKFIGEDNGVLLTMPLQEYRNMANYIKVSSKLNFLTAPYLFAGDVLHVSFLKNGKKQFDDLFDRGQGLYNKALDAAGKMIFQVTQVGGTILDKLGLYMTLASKGFPNAIKNPAFIRSIASPSGKLEISNHYLETLFNNIFNHTIRIDKDLISFVEINGSKLIDYDENLKALMVSFSQGKIGVKDGNIKNTFTIKNCTIEFLPDINIVSGSIFMNFKAVITHLDLKDCNPIIDKMIAWAIQVELLNSKPLASINVSNLVNHDFGFELTGKKDISTNRFPVQHFSAKLSLNDFAWDIVHKTLLLSTKLEVK